MSIETSLATPRISVQPVRDNYLVRAALDALGDAESGVTKMPTDIFRVHGMSGRRYRIFLNQLIEKISSPRYLEVGSFQGSTLISAIFGNPQVQAIAIDNFSEFDGPANKFFVHTGMAHPQGARVSFINADFRKVQLDQFAPFNVYLFDGPHGHQDQIDGIEWAWPHLSNPCVLMVDDWNWERIRTPTVQALKRVGAVICLSIEVRTTIDDGHPDMADALENSDWHNGCGIFVVERP